MSIDPLGGNGPVYSDEQAYGGLYATLGVIYLVAALVVLLAEAPQETERLASRLAVFCIMAGYAGVHVAGGIGLRRGKRAGRIAIQVLGAIYLFGFPFYTLLGVLTLRALTRRAVSR